MPRNSKAISVSLPADLSHRLDSAAMQADKTRSEFVRDALIRHLDYFAWKDLLEYGDKAARTRRISADDVNGLIEEYRVEIASRPEESGPRFERL